MDEVAEGLWLGRFYPEGPRRVAAAARHSTDRAAARRALLAIEGTGLDRPPGSACSLSHTEGVGAALLDPRGRRLGVDVVRIDRVSTRHAEAILAAGEWSGLRAAPRLRPALAWALKEAAAKATGDPASFFPSGLRVAARGCRAIVVVGPPLELELCGGWHADRDYLWAWVFGGGGRAGSQSRRWPRPPRPVPTRVELPVPVPARAYRSSSASPASSR